MLKHDPTIRDEKIWEDFLEKGLCPEIQCLADYREQFQINSPAAEKLIVKLPSVILEASDIKKLHAVIFNKIYPWAGTFRDHNIFCRGRNGADIENIQMEFEMLKLQMGILLKEASHPRAIARIAAFQHARLTTIQGFPDGNTRTSRAISEKFLTDYLGKPRQKEVEKPIYLEALEAALGKENLAPLASIFSELYGEPTEKTKWVPSPFQTTNQNEVRDILRALPMSYRQRPTILDENKPRAARFLHKWNWEKVAGEIGGAPTKNYDQCQTLWEESRNKEMTFSEVESLIKTLEKMNPFKKKLFEPAPFWGNLSQKIRPEDYPAADPDINMER